MKKVTLTLTFALMAGQLQALSCMRPDPVAAFAQIAQAPEPYYVLYGRLSFDETALPAGFRDTFDGEPAPIPARFEGKGLTNAGFTSDFISPAQLQVECAANYCGTAQSGIDALFFVRADQTPVTMIAGPCGGMIFPEPSQALRDQITACMQGGC
ncbi:hypothetical protein SAMN04488005_0130 [Yoonia tamlensis]|uniref:Uncharacterized protein n=1 Tax=Yoonia tamlensis TaxID=390270 RepID=A0A1I6FNY1_9RHOB|nr:hypothetical protein [Yoonia tamlensis]SFR31652.1 hypothetical protein SAMN04488005_0130 [Yoonia tamlensis]